MPLTNNQKMMLAVVALIVLYFVYKNMNKNKVPEAVIMTPEPAEDDE